MYCFCTILCAQSVNATYQAYIEQYRDIAIAQQKKHGIPASITLAQGILESAAGKSELAMKAKNHFGIKCTSDWTGPTYSHDDNKAGECFRKYSNVSNSFEDHSLFLKRSRYASLFELSVKDYKNWAYGLKACGYATDPKYPEKLIRIIELYDLDKLASGKNIANTSGDSKKKKLPQKTQTLRLPLPNKNIWKTTVCQQWMIWNSFTTIVLAHAMELDISSQGQAKHMLR